MLLLACGSRSMSSVFLPRMASAAARLTAVVVLPTPPFWLAIATIIDARLIVGAGSETILGMVSECVKHPTCGSRSDVGWATLRSGWRPSNFLLGFLWVPG